MLALLSSTFPILTVCQGRGIQILLVFAFLSFTLATLCFGLFQGLMPGAYFLKNETVSDQARIEMRITRAGEYRGRSPGLSRVSYALVSGVGVMGMFAAIVGSMLGVWLDETTDESDDGDSYCFWDDGEWDVDDDAGWEREQHYAGMRELGSLMQR